MRDLYFLKLNTSTLARQFDQVLSEAVKNGTVPHDQVSQYYIADFYQWGRWTQCYGYNDTVVDCSPVTIGYTFQPTNAINATLPPQLTFGDRLPSDLLTDIVLFKELGYIVFSFVFLSTLFVAFATFILLPFCLLFQTRFIKVCKVAIFLAWLNLLGSVLFMAFSASIDTVLFYRSEQSFFNDGQGSGPLGPALWIEWASLVAIFMMLVLVWGGCCCGLGGNTRGPAILVGGKRARKGATVVKTTDGDVRHV